MKASIHVHFLESAHVHMLHVERSIVAHSSSKAPVV